MPFEGKIEIVSPGRLEQRAGLSGQGIATMGAAMSHNKAIALLLLVTP